MNNKFKILLGDNPFFGIDHLSQERARERQKRLSDFSKIVNIVNYAYRKGISGFVVSTHPELKLLLKEMEKTGVARDMDFYPILPYVQGYVNRVTQKGLRETLKEVLSGGSIKDKLRILSSGSFGFLKKDFDKLFHTFIDVELLSLRSRRKRIFLHDVVTDLSVGLGMSDLISSFIYYIKDQYNTEAGLVTKNLPLLVSKLQEWDLKPPTIMTSFNPIGNQMNPSKEDYEECVNKYKLKIIAMNVLAGGIVKPSSALQYVREINPEYAVIGMSTEKHVDEIINEYDKI